MDNKKFHKRDKSLRKLQMEMVDEGQRSKRTKIQNDDRKGTELLTQSIEESKIDAQTEKKEILSSSSPIDHEEWQNGRPLNISIHHGINNTANQTIYKTGEFGKKKKGYDRYQRLSNQEELIVVSGISSNEFNYAEDDKFNQSYVERVINTNMPINDRSIRNSSASDVNKHSTIQTPAKSLTKDMDFYREFQQHIEAQRYSTIIPDQRESYQSHPMIQDIRNNNFSKVKKAIGHCFIGANDSATITGRITQQRRRQLRNSFQPGQLNRSATRAENCLNALISDGVVNPKTKVNLPKPLILYQISKNMDQMRFSENFLRGQLPGQRSESNDQFLNNKQKMQLNNKSFLEFIENAELNIPQGGGLRKPKRNRALGKSVAIIGNEQSQLATTIEASTMQQNIESRVGYQRITTNNSSLLKDRLHDKFNNTPSRSITHGEQSFDSQAPTFHITDLLEKSIVNSSLERDQNKLSQIIKFYKRQVKNDNDLNQKKELLIRNYRIHVVKEQELEETQRKFFTYNKGTSIPVSNSILKPEKFKYGTKVSNQIRDAFPELDENAQNLPSIEQMQGKMFLSGRLNSRHTNISDKFYSEAPEDTAEMLFEEDKENEEMDYYSQIYESSGRSDTPNDINEGEFSSKSSKETSQRIQRQRIAELYPHLNDRKINEQITQTSRLFSPADAEHFQAISLTNKIFEKWLRGIYSQKSSVHARIPTRQKLSNGQEAYPRLTDLKWHISTIDGSALKVKPLPIERLSEKSVYDQAPYRQLQMLVVNHDIREWYSKFVLKTSTIKPYSQIANKQMSSMNYFECKIAIDFSRYHLTHLDPIVFRDDKLPHELFMESSEWIKPLQQKVKQCKLQQELDENYEGIECKTDYYFSDGGRKEISVYVSDFDPYTQKFLVSSRAFNISTWRSRLYIRLQDDNRTEIEAKKLEVMAWKAESLHYLRLHRLIIDQMLKRYNYLELKDDTLRKIQSKLHIDLFLQNPDSVRKLILQIEALYVFSILKAVLQSQRNDPFIKAHLFNYKVPLNSPALENYILPPKEKSQLEGIEEFHMKGIKLELDNNSLILTNSKYIKIPIFLYKLTQNTIGLHQLFCWPYDTDILRAQNAKEYEKVKDLEVRVNEFPLNHEEFVKAQKVMSHYFHQIAKFKWAEQIAEKIGNNIRNDFDIVQGQSITEEQIDPCLTRLFYQIKLYMQTVIFEHFEDALRNYCIFLLGFILRDVEMRSSKVIDDVKMSAQIRLDKKQAHKVREGNQIMNDTDLIKIKRQPMLIIYADIDEFQVVGKQFSKHRIITSPELDNVNRDLFSIILEMHKALQEIDRVDQIVLPILKMKQPYLLVPDVNSNKKLQAYVTIIEKLIDLSMKSTKKEIHGMNSFMNLFDQRVENVILDLKKRSFQLQQELNMAEEEAEQEQDQDLEQDLKKEQGEKEIDVEGESSKSNTIGSEKNEEQEEEKGDNKVEGEEDDSYGEDEEDNQEDGYQGNDLAYKSVEIDDGLMKEELFKLRANIWKILEGLNNQYDFGLVCFDCTKFKNKILSHVRGIIDHLEGYIKTDFLHKQRNIQSEILLVKGKLDMEVDSIDDVIMLLDYIDSLKNQGDKVGDIKVMIDELAKRWIYIESVQIIFPDEQFEEYLQIRNWPRTFRSYIETRKSELMAMKDSLYDQMAAEIQEVFEQIEEFKLIIQEILQMGLTEPNPKLEKALELKLRPPQKSQRKSQKIGESEEGESSSTEEENQLVKSKGVTFYWIGLEIGFIDQRFDPYFIEQVYNKIEFLKHRYDQVERETNIINKRESLLGVPKTEFLELKTIQDKLKPLYEMWIVASNYAKHLPIWIEGQFDQLDAAFIEIKTDEWLNEMRRLQKTNLVNDPKQMDLLRFIMDSLNHFKRYGPMLRTLRTKGLATRHWVQVSDKIGIKINPAQSTLHGLISLGLYEEEKLSSIKAVCEVATKEYAVQQALETLDKEMKSVEFEFEFAMDGTTAIVLKLPELIASFEEFYLRMGVLKTNPNIKNFREKLNEIGKIIENVVNILNAWADFQRNYIYLNGIFILDEIQQALPVETKAFLQIQNHYNQTSKSFQLAPHVYKINFRENFITLLHRSNQECDTIRLGLRNFLERKRGQFPRLYFLSNEELIDIFGKGQDLVPSMMSGESISFMTNLFEGVDHLIFSEKSEEVIAMISKEGEEVQMVQPVRTKTLNVENWLLQFELQMTKTMKYNFFYSFQTQDIDEFEQWIEKWPGQTTYLSIQVWFTKRIEAIFQGTYEREKFTRYIKNRQAEEIEGTAEKLTDEEQERINRFPLDLQEIEKNRTPEEQLIEEMDDDRAYLEELARTLTKEEINAPEQANLEKIFRLRKRFRINTGRLPSRQMEILSDDITKQILKITAMVRKKLKRKVRQAATALLTVGIYQRDILVALKRDKVYNKEEFKWQMQFKFELKGLQEAIAKSSYARNAPGVYETDKIYVNFEVFGHFRKYGFEYLGNCSRLVVTPLTERCQRSLLIALQYHYGGAPEGPFGTGKTETAKDLSRQIGKLCFVMNCSANFEYSGVCRFFKGLAQAGAWVVFDEFNRMEYKILSMLAQVMISLQAAIKARVGLVQLEDVKIKLKGDSAVMITLNPGYAGRQDLPLSLKALFRPISMVVPDSIFITEILLYSSGFLGAQQLAQKIVQTQNRANHIMRSTEIKHDFGLRSIKAIVQLAEILKLQAQGIKESDLAEIIDDVTLSNVPYKTDQLIKNVMQNSQRRLMQILGTQRSVEGVSASIANSADQSDSSDAESLNYNNKIERGYISRIDQQSPTNLETLSFTAEDNNTQNTQVDVEGTSGYVSAKEGGLYKRVWQRITKQERQRRTVYKQIGINPDQMYEEEELEEYIILKAVRDYNHSKFAEADHIIIEGVIKDVFQSAVPDLDAPIVDYGNLHQTINQSFTDCKLDPSETLRQRAFQLYEIIKSKHGCIIVGKPQSSKSTLVYLLQHTLNKAAMNEFMLAIQDKRRSALIKLAKEHEHEVADEKTNESKNMQSQMINKKRKKGDKDANQRRQINLYQELYKKTKLTEDQMNELRNNLKIKGVALKRINPKGMSLDEFIGSFDGLSHEWIEGIFTTEFRRFSLMNNDKKKWILLDGPIDYNWVENFNSILDDNRKISLPNGEQIKMSEGMALLFETDNLLNVTPATVSRCGLVFMHRQDILQPKSIFNSFLRNLPPNLHEFEKEIETITNYFIVDALEIFEMEVKTGQIAFQGYDTYWIMQSFLRFLTTMMFDYYIDYEKSGALNSQMLSNPNELGRSLQNLTLHNQMNDAEPDPNLLIYPNNDDQESRVGSNQSRRSASKQKVQTPEAFDRELGQSKRLPRCNFIDSEDRYENALKFTPLWLEAFIIFSIVWTFQPALSAQGRKTLDKKLQEKYELARSDFGVYQREKKRKLKERNKARQHEMQKQMKQSKLSSKKTAAPQTISHQGTMKDLLGGDFNSKKLEKPLLISNFPEGGSFFDYYFNLDTSEWEKFNVESAISQAVLSYDKIIPSQRKAENIFIPSYDSVRYSHVLEIMISKQNSTMVIGPQCSGRSALLKQVLFCDVFDYTRQLITEHITLSLHSDSTLLKENVETMLEYKTDKDTGIRALRPHNKNNLIVYIQDLHMAHTDQYGDQSAIESIRDYFTSKCWLSPRKNKLRNIENLSFFCCMASNSPETSLISKRILHRFNVISLEQFKTESMRELNQALTDFITSQWPSAVHLYSKSIVDGLMDITAKIFEKMKPTPMKVHYTFNWRDLSKVLFSMAMVEGNFLRKPENVMSLFYHECLRTFGDRLLMEHDKQWFLKTLEQVCREHFHVCDDNNKELLDMRKSLSSFDFDKVLLERKTFFWPIKNPNDHFFSLWNQEVEGYYIQINDFDKISQVIEGTIERYNSQNDRGKLGLLLYDSLNRMMIKILRVINAPNGNLITICMKGYGMSAAIKLVTFTASQQLRAIETYEGFSDEEWKSELRRAIMYCGAEDKPLTFFIDEYKLLKDQWYTDLECVLKNNMSSEITRKSEIYKTLLNIHREVEKEKKGMKLGLSTAELKKGYLAQRDSDFDEDNLDKRDKMIQGSKKMLQRYPHIQAELYNIFLNRIKSNFHLILMYSPTGSNFRDKLSKHKEIMYLSQMIFMNELPLSELEQLGRSYLAHEKIIAEEKALIGEASNQVNYDTRTPKEKMDDELATLKCISQVYNASLDFAQQYTEDEEKTIYFTPAHFLRIFTVHKKLIKERYSIMKGISTKYEHGLEKLKSAQDAIYNYHKNLEARSPILQEKLSTLIRIIGDIEEEFMRIKAQRDQLKRDAFEAETYTDSALKIRDNCQETLDKIVPALSQAMNAVQAIQKQDIAELKSMKKPPKVVKLILQIVCLLLGIKPAIKKSKKNGKFKESYWKAAQGPELLGNPNLSKILIEFDKNKVTADIMMQVEEVLNHPEYSYERAFTASGAATGIFKWASATRDYFYIFKEIEPRRDAFMLSQKQYLEKRDILKDKSAQIKKLDTALYGLKEHQQSKDMIIEDLRADIQDCNLRKKRADALLRGLQAEKQKWLVCMRMLRERYHTVIGDVLLTAIYITILSGFTQKYRGKCIEKAMRIMRDEGIQTSDEFKFSELFGDALKIRKWHNNYLPTDEMSINNALVIEKTKKFCLLIDPQSQGIVWLRAVCEEAGNLVRMNHDDPKLQERMGTFIEVGKVVIIEQVQNVINQTLLSILKQQKSKQAGSTHINFCRKQYKYDKNFRLYVVSAHPRPEFDSHITNHITLINFSIDMESLTAQILTLVVKNERSDLENIAAECHKEAIECIKSLKDTEQNILSQLNNEVNDLLSDEQLIQTLDESKATAEFVAAKLQEIQATQRMINKSKAIYMPIAFRAAKLYFLISNLQKINRMYRFSLNWFKSLFKRSMELTNVVRSNDPAQQEQKEEMGALHIPQGTNFAFSREKRVELLTKTFTHELYKRISSSIFYKDKTLVQYYLAIQVMKTENCIQQDLFDFLINGADVLPGEFGYEQFEFSTSNEWLTGNMWIDLVCLSKLKPFNEKNLLEHLQENPQVWTKYYYNPQPTVKDLPNKVKLDCNFFVYDNDDQIKKQQKDEEKFRRQLDRRRFDREVQETEAQYTEQQKLFRTESEILNDENIWNITTESETENDDQISIVEQQEGPKTIEQDMAKYLITETPPQTQDNQEMAALGKNILQKGSIAFKKKEKAIKQLCELCVLRCIRPEMLLDGMQRFIKLVLDPSYQNFREDILKPMIIEEGQNPDKILRRQSPSVQQAKQEEEKRKQQTLASTKKKPQVMKSSQNMLIHKKLKEQELKETVDEIGSYDQLKGLVAQAYQDSDCLTPILFLTTRQIDIYEVVSEFQKKCSLNNQLYRCQLMKGQEETANEMLEKSIATGDWVLLENLQMVESWLLHFDELVTNWKPNIDHNTRFRVFITCIPTPDFPLNLARQSIKIIIEPPQTIKEEIFQLVSVQEQQSFFKKSGRFSNFHKNIFFALAYFHSIIRGRIGYGNLGWNYSYQFDFSDFEISNAQLSEQIRNCNQVTGTSDPIDAALQTLEYLFANINYAGKIQRVEDQLTLNAIMSELINIKNAKIEELEPNMDRSHFGFPSEDCPDFYMFVKVNIPDDDPHQVFGFDENQQFKIHIDQSNSLFEALINLNREEITESMEEGHCNPNIEINAARTRLKSGDLIGKQIQEMIDNKEGILGIIIRMQKMLNFSSLDTTIIQLGKRYDQRVNDPTLVIRDANDNNVVELGKQLIQHIKKEYPLEEVLEKFPVKYKQPLNNVVHKELLSFKILLDRICKSVTDLIEDMAGKYPRPIDIQKLWRHIQLNRIPSEWLLYSFKTAHISMANYLIELQMKLDFWKNLLKHDSLLDVPVFWLPAFYNPNAFLFAMSQTRSRFEEIPITEFLMIYEVQTFMEIDQPSEDSYSLYLNGFWLQGADWNVQDKHITEITRKVNFVQFPVVKLSVRLKQEISRYQSSMASVRSVAVEEQANQSPNSPNTGRTNNRPLELEFVKVLQEDEDGQLKEVQVQRIVSYNYSCPVFHTTQRLSSKEASDTVPVERINFKTYDSPTKWIKRSVALILEPSYD